MIDEAPPTPEDRLTTIAENIEVTVSNLFGLLIVRGYSDDDVRQVAGECLERALAVRDEWPEYSARPL